MTEETLEQEQPPEQEQSPLPWPKAFSLVPAAGQGALFFGEGAMILIWFGFSLWLNHFREAIQVSDPPRPFPWLMLLTMLVAFAIGVGLLRFQTWARWATVGFGLLAGVGVVILAMQTLSALVLVFLLVMPLALAFPVCGAWFSEEGKAAAARVPVRTYQAALLWGYILMFTLSIFIPPLCKLFDETGIPYSYPMEMTVDLSGFVTDWSWALVPLLLTLPTPLLRVRRSLDKTWALAVSLIGLSAFGTIAGAVIGMFLSLIEKL